ncbi:MAG: hypothetical protein AMXMBFR17_05180 [Candidatus Jettenia caeni]|nr:MAG: hypothetical protein JETCAE04_18970 [Candidatus Jettenia caeni]
MILEAPGRVARTNGFVRAYLLTYMDMDYKTLTNKVCQYHPRYRFTEYELIVIRS